MLTLVLCKSVNSPITPEGSGAAPFGLGSVTKTICKFTQEESHSLVIKIIGKQNLALAMDADASLSHGLGAIEVNLV